MSPDDLGNSEPVVFSAQPSEGDNVLYLRVGPPTKGKPPLAMIYLILNVTNNLTKTLTLKNVNVTFPGSQVPPQDFARNDVVEPGFRYVELGGQQVIKLSTVPPEIQISLSFAELDEPAVGLWPLVPHPTAYDFFCRAESDPAFGEYVLLPHQHVDGGGIQHFAYDAVVKGWNANGQLASDRTNGIANEDAFAWGRPLYSMADGLVLDAVNTWPDNPAQGKRRFISRGRPYTGSTQISAVSVANISPPEREWSRFVVGVITGTKAVELMLFEQSADGTELKKLCTATGAAAERISVLGITRNSVVTLTQLGTKTELTMWSVPSDKVEIVPINSVTIPGTVSGRVSVLHSGLLVTATRTATGKVDLMLWQIANGKLVAKPAGQAVSQSGPAYDVQAFDPHRFALATRTAEGNLRLDIWALIGGSGSGGSGQDEQTVMNLELLGTGGGGAVSEIVLVDNYEADQVTTAVRTGSGTLKVILWNVPDQGDPVRWVEDEYPGTAAGIDASLFSGGTMGVGYRENGKLRLRALLPDEDKNLLWEHHELTVEEVDQVALARVPTKAETLVSAVRSSSGVLKVYRWQVTGSNLIRILYGNELVKLVHLKQGSIPKELISDEAVPVKRGQLIGRIGNSGRSSGPHVHVDTYRLTPDELNDIPELMKRVRAGEEVGELRPLQFKGVLAMHNSGVKKGGAQTNPLAAWDGHGAYFADYVVLPPAK